MIGIYDKETRRFWIDEDGFALKFESETAARNFLFTEGYKPEFVETGIELKEID